MQFLPNTKTLCLSYAELVEPTGILPEGTYKSAKRRGTITVHGRGGNGSPILIEYETMPENYKKAVMAKYGNPYEYHARQPLLALLKKDMLAAEFYATHLLSDGRNLPIEYQTRYARQCDWFNMINTVIREPKTLRDELGISIGQFWDNCISLAQNDTIPNDLPGSYKRFTARWRLYNEEGYKGLISSNFGNQKTRKVNNSIERLLMSLALMPDRPNNRTIAEYYQRFMAGELRVVDMESGEVFDPQAFYVKGKPYLVTESTVKHYIDNKPVNRAYVDKRRLSNLQYITRHRPHHMRKAPVYALSKITMDDISIPFKMHNGKRVMSYQVFDVCSQAVIGVSFSKDKTQEIVRDCLRDMFRNIMRHNWPMPLEVEIEQHLNSGMKGRKNEAGDMEADIFTAGALFPFVRFCAARNPQEKRAEGFIKLKKYGFQKNRAGFQYRPFAKNDNNLENDEAKELYYTYEQIVANEMADIAAYNNALHTDQQTYPNMTRWQVLMQNLNTELAPANIATILPYIGQRVRTSINRGYISISNGKYRLADIKALQKLTSTKVIAYTLTDENGAISYVHLYDGAENPICRAIEAERFQEAAAERGEDDRRIMSEQAEYIAAFDKMVKQWDETLVPVGIVTSEQAEDIARQAENAPQTVENEPENDSNEGGYRTNCIPDEPWFMNPDEVKRRAQKGI